MRRLALACLFSLLVGACGKDGTPAPAPSPTPPAPTPAPAPAPPTNRTPVVTSATLTPGFGLAFFTTFQLSGRATDADGDALTYSWSILNSSNNVVTTLPGADVTFNSQSLLRSAVARLTVSDGRGGTTTADTARFNVGSMTGTWVMTSTRFPGVAMLYYVLQQAQSGAVTGEARSTAGGPAIGVTDPAGGARIDAAGNLQNLRIKFTAASNAVDFTVAGQMQPTVDINATISNTTATFNNVPINGLAVTLSPQ